MPRLIVPRGDAFGARARKTHRWLGTFPTRDAASLAIERESCSRAHRAPSRARRDVKPPSEAQVVLLAAEAAQTMYAWLSPMILVAAYTGLRLFEVAGLEPGDLIAPADGTGWRLCVRRGKGGYRDEVSVVFDPALGVLLEACRLGEPGRPLFAHHGHEVTRQTMARAFKPVSQRVGFGGTFHALRHFHACWLIDGGATDLDVAAQLRHHDNGELVRRRYGRHRATRAALLRIESARP